MNSRHKNVIRSEDLSAGTKEMMREVNIQSIYIYYIETQSEFNGKTRGKNP